MSPQKQIGLCPSEKLSSRLLDQKRKGEFCDITLVMCGVDFPVHSCVASSSSGYVRQELSSQDNKVMSPRIVIDLSDQKEEMFCRECAEKVVDFMYCCGIQVDLSHLHHINSLSKKLQIPELISLSLPNTAQSYSDVHTDAASLYLSSRLQVNGQCINSDVGKAQSEQDWAPEESLNITCPKCKESFSSDIMLQQHCNTHLDKFYSCFVCDYSTLKMPYLLEHLKEANHMEVVCSLCLYETDTNAELQEHMKEHDHAQPFFCRSCYHRFQTRTALNSHIVKHSTETPFLCSVCGRGFKWKQGLQSHMFTHTSMKKHLCDQCGYSTAHLKSFQDHKTIHTGKKFKCPISACGFSSARKDGVKQHMTTHSKEKSYQCEVCGQAFSQAKNLRRHAAMHDPGAQLATCPFCPFQTMRSDKFKSHIRSCYKKENSEAPAKKRKTKSKLVGRSQNEGVSLLEVERPNEELQTGIVEIVETEIGQTLNFESNSSTDIKSAGADLDINQFLITTCDENVVSLGQDPVNIVICNPDGSLNFQTITTNAIDVNSVNFQQCENPTFLQVETVLSP